MPRPIRIRDIARLRQTIPDDLQPAYPPLAPAIAVTVMVPTYDRPAMLRRCLSALTQQVTPRPVTWLVVDNHPQSGLTAPIAADFPQVNLIQEPVAGSSRARNAGIRACRTGILVMVDDDVVVPDGWLENLLAPFSQPAVSAVTGQVVPLEVKTHAQQLFEVFGGLGRGWERRRVDRQWADEYRFSAVPSWELGATVNAAFRTEIFHNPQIGLLHEALGGGVPAKGGEDTYFLYKVLQGGGTLVYEPTAWLWHGHREELSHFARQVQSYRQGHIAHHLTALVEEGDWRSLIQLCLWLQLYDGWRILARLRGAIDYPISLILREIWGNFVGVRGWWQARQLLKQRQAKHHSTEALFLD